MPDRFPRSSSAQPEHWTTLAIRIEQVIAAGARGYVLKEVTGQELVAAIKLVYEGQS